LFNNPTSLSFVLFTPPLNNIKWCIGQIYWCLAYLTYHPRCLLAFGYHGNSYPSLSYSFTSPSFHLLYWQVMHQQQFSTSNSVGYMLHAESSFKNPSFKGMEADKR
jgi:hypothetical protein